MLKISDVVVFDLDGTLIKGNSFHLWLLFILMDIALEIPFWTRFMVICDCVGRGLRFYSHADMKRRILWRIGMWHTNKAAHRFVNDWLLPKVSQVCVNELAIWQQQGVTLVLATAAPWLYAAEIGRHFGFDAVEATIWQPNKEFIECKGEEKVRRVIKYLPLTGLLTAYTDHHDDLPLLKIAKQPVLVNPSGRTMQIVAKLFNTKVLTVLRG